MIFSNDLIESILTDHLFDVDIYQLGKFQCGFDELVEGVTIELNLIADTERQLKRIHDEETMFNEEHHKSMKELEEERAEVINQCKHHSTTYRRDASGNTSTNTCDTCGAEVARGG